MTKLPCSVIFSKRYESLVIYYRRNSLSLSVSLRQPTPQTDSVFPAVGKTTRSAEKLPDRRRPFSFKTHYFSSDHLIPHDFFPSSRPATARPRTLTLTFPSHRYHDISELFFEKPRFFVRALKKRPRRFHQSSAVDSPS